MSRRRRLEKKSVAAVADFLFDFGFCFSKSTKSGGPVGMWIGRLSHFLLREMLSKSCRLSSIQKGRGHRCKYRPIA